MVLRPDGREQVSAPGRTEEIAHELLDRVAKETGESPLRVNVLRNLSSLVIEATPKFIQRLLEKDEVQSAIANQQSKSAVNSQSNAPVTEAVKGRVATKAVKRRPAASSEAAAVLRRSKPAKKK